MKNKILKLAKRMGKFTIEEIEPILMANKIDIMPAVKELLEEKSLILNSNGIYFYVENNNKKADLPLFFEYHSREDIELVIKCFCADIEVAKAKYLLGLSKNNISKFYKYFRELIYNRQLNKLEEYFINEPKVGREREYMGKPCFLYLYNDELFISKKFLNNKKISEVKNEERLKIKNLYLRVKRKVLNFTYSHFHYLHLAEEIWRTDKDFLTLYEDIKSLCSL